MAVLVATPGCGGSLSAARRSVHPGATGFFTIIEAGWITSRGPLSPGSAMPIRLLNDTGARHLPAASMMAPAFNVAGMDVMTRLRMQLVGCQPTVHTWIASACLAGGPLAVAAAYPARVACSLPSYPVLRHHRWGLALISSHHL